MHGTMEDGCPCLWQRPSEGQTQCTSSMCDRALPTPYLTHILWSEPHTCCPSRLPCRFFMLLPKRATWREQLSSSSMKNSGSRVTCIPLSNPDHLLRHTTIRAPRPPAHSTDCLFQPCTCTLVSSSVNCLFSTAELHVNAHNLSPCPAWWYAN